MRGAFLTVPEFAEMIRRSTPRAREIARDAGLTMVQFRGCGPYVLLEDEVDEWLAGLACKADGGAK